MKAKEHPSVKPGICGVTQTTGNTEWICVKEVHSKVYRGRRGKRIFSNNPSADQHYFVNRYPNRKVTDE